MGSFNFSDLPVGKAFVGTNDRNIIVTFERINSNTVRNLCFNPDNGHEVLRAEIPVGQGDTKLKRLDTDFWTVKVDGQVSSDVDLDKVRNVSVDANDNNRFVEISTN